MSSHSAAAAESAGRRFRRWLIVFSVAAFLLRLAVALEISGSGAGYSSMFRPSPATDLATYMRLGQEVASGSYKGVFYYQPFYYAVFLPLIYLLTGTSLWAVVFIQSLLGGLSVWFTGLCAEKLSGSRAGALAAGGAVAISTPLLLYAPFHQNETLQSFNLTLLFYLTLLTAEKFSFRRIILCGAVSGIAILTRGNVWLLTPLCAAAVVSGCFKETADRKNSLKRAVAGVLLYLAVLLAVQSYFICRNTLINGRLTGPSTAADAVLALGNSVEAPPGGRDSGLPAGPMEYPESFQLMMERVSRDGISVPGQMLEWLMQEPLSFLELQFRKALLFWDHREIPNNVSLYGEGEYSTLLRWLLPGRSGILLTLALAGLLLSLPDLFRRRNNCWICLGFIVIYWLSVAVFYNLSRFRAPILPVVFTGIALLWRYREELPPVSAEGDQRRRRILAALLVMAAAGWLTFASFDFYRRRMEANVLRLVRPEGVKLEFPDGRSKYFDHGPFSFGGWCAFTLSPGDVPEKVFAVPEGKAGRSFKWHITVNSNGGGSLRLRQDGREERYFTLSSGVNTIVLDTLPEQGGRCSFKVAGVTGDAALVLDSQRDYGRSSVNGGATGGEWVMRLEEVPPPDTAGSAKR